MGNILTAIQNIIENSSLTVAEFSLDIIQNRANQMGAAFEDFVKDAFAGCFDKDARSVKEKRQATFSYLGNANNPPDAMLRGGDAIEIKKINSIGTAQLQLNSSYPKNKLRSDNPKISINCRDCEDWEERDMIYVVGQIKENELQNMFFVYGDLYCDSPDVYEKVENSIKNGIEAIGELEFSKTNELGRINNVDHLAISDFRIRGMWLIKSPFHQFNYLIENSEEYIFRLIALIPEKKYKEFDNSDEFEKFCIEHNVCISDEDIEDPQNPANSIRSKLITYFVK